MTKSNEIVHVIKPWSGGLNDYSLYITIPSKIVKKLKITEKDSLFIGIKDDSAITISKTNKIRTTTIQKKELNEEHDNTKTQKMMLNLLTHLMVRIFKQQTP